MVFLVTLLANDGMNDRLEYVLLGKDALHVLDQLVSLIHLIILQIVDHQVETSLRDHVNERRQDLEGVLAATENDQVVPQQVIVLEEAP